MVAHGEQSTTSGARGYIYTRVNTLTFVYTKRPSSAGQTLTNAGQGYTTSIQYDYSKPDDNQHSCSFVAQDFHYYSKYTIDIMSYKDHALTTSNAVVPSIGSYHSRDAGPPTCTISLVLSVRTTDGFCCHLPGLWMFCLTRSTSMVSSSCVQSATKPRNDNHYKFLNDKKKRHQHRCGSYAPGSTYRRVRKWNHYIWAAAIYMV